MIKCFNGGLLDSNTYIYYDGEKNGMIIDAGYSPDRLAYFVKENEIKVKYIVLTHGHYDHAHYVEEYRGLFENAEILCHKNERAVLYDCEANLSPYFGEPKVYAQNYRLLEDDEKIKLSNEAEFTVINLPGHTPGCIALYLPNEKIMFTGDVLFACGYGRTDFKGGSPEMMRGSLKRLSKMDGDIRIYPGHYESALLKNT